MPDEISVIAVAELVEHKFMQATGNAAGVQRVDRVATAGSYQRPPPRAVDTSGLDADQVETVRELFKSSQQPVGSVRCLALKDATVAGQGSVVTRDGRLLHDSAREFFANGRPPDGFETVAEGKLRLTVAEQRQIAAPSLLLKRPWWRNYGHWLVDSAAMLALATRLRLPAGWQIVVGRQQAPRMREIVAETAAILAPGVPVVEHPDEAAWRFSTLFYPTPLYVPPLFKHPEGLASLRAMLLRELVREPAGQRRLFVSRGDHPARRLQNEAELIAIAQARGYEVVRPELLDLAGQAQLFRSAGCVVGVKGAALTNLIFCPGGASALVLSPGEFPDPFFWDLACHASLGYAEMFGQVTSRDRPRSHNPFVIDPARFAELLPR
jgi:capsular polysaccharide biosynthesis protein